MVAFLDLQCPFCQRVQPTLAALRQRYGPGRLHIVTKHLPLPFHQQAHFAAQVARVVLQVAGTAAFDEFVKLVYSDQGALDREHLLELAAWARAPRSRVEPLVDSDRVAQRVDDDLRVAGQLGVNGTPGFLVNGIRIPALSPSRSS